MDEVDATTAFIAVCGTILVGIAGLSVAAVLIVGIACAPPVESGSNIIEAGEVQASPQPDGPTEEEVLPKTIRTFTYKAPDGDYRCFIFSSDGVAMSCLRTKTRLSL